MQRLIRTEQQAAPLCDPRLAPGILRHLANLSGSFVHEDNHIPFLHIYAKPGLDGPASLKFISAAESGPEGIACVDDVARAVLLALQTYEAQRAPAALNLARAWFGFVAYMQEPDGRFVNFIRTRNGRKNRTGRTSYAGGQWWTTRAVYAAAAGWRITADPRYLRVFTRTPLPGVRNLKVTALQALALMEMYRSEPGGALAGRITALCDRILAAESGYFRDRAWRDDLEPWGYHQLQAMARAGQLFGRIDYLAACERTVEHAIAPLIAARFAPVAPWQGAPQCAYGVSAAAQGLADLYRATGKSAYRNLALRCAGWLYGDNPSGTSLYDPRTGCCSDGLCGDQASANCGAESTIEAGFIELTRRELEPGRPMPTVSAPPAPVFCDGLRTVPALQGGAVR